MQLYSTHVYEANSSLLLKSETSIVIYYVFPSSEHVLASSLELWLLRYYDLLHLALTSVEQINQALATEIDPLAQIKHSDPFLLCCCGLRTSLNAS